MLVQELCDLCRIYVFSALEEALSEGWNGIRVGAHQVGHDFSEPYLIFYGGNGPLVEGFEGR